MANTADLPSLGLGMNKTPPGDPAPPTNSRGPDTTPATGAAKADDEKLLRTALKRFKSSVAAEAENRKAALEDLKFKAGEQWPAAIKQDRDAEKRPCLTINTIPTLTHQVTNDIRQNRPAIQVSPVGSRSNKESAQIFAGMIRAIERDSAADVAYDTAITSAADIGFGYCRLLTEYESENSFNQVVVIRRVRNPFSVYLDPARQEPDGSDASWGFVSDLIERDEFHSMYPDADPLPWTERGVGDELSDWVTKDHIRVAEYFVIERTPDRLVMLDNGHTGIYSKLAPGVKAQITAGELRIVASREVDTQKVMWYKITATEVLSRQEWPGRWIPIAEFVGEEIDLQGKVVRSGVIRNAKDPQRMKNYWASYKTEVVALAPKAPYIGAEGQFEGYGAKWREAATKSFPYLEYVPVSLDGTPVPPPQKQPPTPVPAGAVEAEQSAERDMMSTSGIRFNAAQSMQNVQDESGLALREIRRNNDVGSFHYMDNAQVTLRHIGRMLVDLIAKVYDTKRVITTLGEDGTETRVTLNPAQGQPMAKQPNERDEAARTIFNPQVGEYGVTVTVGPSYATRRIEAHDQLMKFITALPEKGALIAHLVAKYSDWPGSDEVYKVLVKALPPQFLTPDMQDMPPQAQQLIQSLMQQLQGLMVERGQMLRDLTTTREDQATKRLKVQRDFEAKVLTILGNMRMKMMDFNARDLQMATGLSNQYPPGFPAGIPDPMQPPGVPGPQQAPGPVPGLNMQQQLPPGIQGLPVSPVTPGG